MRTQRAAYEEAEPLFQRSLEIREMALGSEHPSVARTLNNLADLYEATDRQAEASTLRDSLSDLGV